MRAISRSTLKHLANRMKGSRDYSAIKASLDAWFFEARNAQWKHPNDIRLRYATASIISSERAVFNIKGNGYRPIAAVDYEKPIVWIKWIGTHRDDDRIDARTVR